ncbi:SseB family protein [Granulicoccus sp. GXG6511]|uniref:SseB family protein n=1 Tax=Granulicoccus sp. GXG6511 TaxID=3381351 RepID=UPI003D7DFD96
MSPQLPPGFGENRSLGGYSEEFADDDGRPAAQTRHALAAAAKSPEAAVYLDAVVELCLSRLLVPLLASGDETMQHDPERHAEMAAVLLEQGDGRRAMLAFTGVDSLTAWNPEARPVPATLDVVADTATQSSAGTVIVDLAGPDPIVIEGSVLENLALGRRLVRLPDDTFGWLAPAGGHEAADHVPDRQEKP